MSDVGEILREEDRRTGAVQAESSTRHVTPNCDRSISDLLERNYALFDATYLRSLAPKARVKASCMFDDI